MIKKLLEDLYNGDYSFVEQPAMNNKKYVQSLNKCTQLQESLKTKLQNEEDKILVEKLWDSFMDLTDARELQAYKAGIQFTIQFLLEGLSKEK